MISAIQLEAIFPHAGARLSLFVEPLNEAMTKFAIVTPKRAAAFLAQTAHESGELLYMRELASGEAYENRQDLGNTQPGDGPRYKGGGPIEITGRYNFRMAGQAIGIDLEGRPELIEIPENGCKASAWWWASHGLNELADRNLFDSLTRKINPARLHMDERLGYWLIALKVVGAW